MVGSYLRDMSILCGGPRESLYRSSVHRLGSRWWICPYVVIDEKFAYSIPQTFSDKEAAPLLCVGIIGYRALRRSQLPPGGRQESTVSRFSSSHRTDRDG